MHRHALVVALLLVSPSVAHAQRAEATAHDSARAATLARLPAAATLRVWTRDPAFAYHVGTLIAARPDGLLLRRKDGDTLHVPMFEIDGLQRSTGRRTVNEAMGRGAGYGVLVGGSLGVIATTAAAIHDRRNPCRGCYITSAFAVGAASMAVTAVSAIVGGFVGLAAREKWVREWPPRR